MSNKLFDITIFGATGLTGKQIVRHVFELSVDKPDFYSTNFRWAIAGRSAEKLEEIINEMANRYPNATIEKPTVLVANITQREQLDAMTSQSKVIINAVGPFRFMGEYVVRSCVENGCDYVDVTGKLQIYFSRLEINHALGEPEFVERMQRTYQDKAAANHVTIVHSCGFDSVS